MAEEYTGIRFTAHSQCWKGNCKVNIICMLFIDAHKSQSYPPIVLLYAHFVLLSLNRVLV